MGNIQVDIAPPANWQDFERLTLDVCRLLWGNPYAERHGRVGQTQSGVDVFGTDNRTGEFVGVQCKKRTSKYKAYEVMPSNSLTGAELDAEIEATKSFYRPLDRFIIAITAARDTEFQQLVGERDAVSNNMRISIWFWDNYVDVLNDSPSLMYRYYENILKYRSAYNPDEHYFRLLAMAFNRPAIRTLLHVENNIEDLIGAISAVQRAVATGQLVDADRHVVDEVRVPKQFAGIKKIGKLLQQVRDLATKAHQEQMIVQQGNSLEIRDYHLATQLNELRQQAVEELNELLKQRGIDCVPYGE